MRAVFVGLVLLLLGACGNLNFPGVYKINVEQGNIITQDMVDQLKPGMTGRQVRFILGTPLLADSFNQSRWDYIYIVRNGLDIIDQNRLTVFFEEDKLSHFSGSFVPTPAAEPEANIEAEAEIDADAEMAGEPTA